MHALCFRATTTRSLLKPHDSSRACRARHAQTYDRMLPVGKHIEHILKHAAPYHNIDSTRCYMFQNMLDVPAARHRIALLRTHGVSIPPSRYSSRPAARIVVFGVKLVSNVVKRDILSNAHPLSLSVLSVPRRDRLAYTRINRVISVRYSITLGNLSSSSAPKDPNHASKLR